MFDLKKLLAAIRRKVEDMARATPIFLVYSPVQYANQPLVGSVHEDSFAVTIEDFERIGREPYALQHAVRWWRDLFFRKVEDWRDEAEWRVVVLVTSRDSFDIDVRKSLVAVIHGDRMTRQDSDSILALTDRPEVEHMGLMWKNGCPWYDFTGRPWSYHDRHLAGFG